MTGTANSISARLRSTKRNKQNARQQAVNSTTANGRFQCRQEVPAALNIFSITNWLKSQLPRKHLKRSSTFDKASGFAHLYPPNLEAHDSADSQLSAAH